MANTLTTTTTYIRESDLVEHFERLLDIGNTFPKLLIASEFNYTEGKVDVIAASGSGELFCFEAKLTRWRAAIYQAYRNTSFSHYSYVVLPSLTARRAVKRRHEFERRGVGLCSVDSNGLTVHIPAVRKQPLQPWLTINAIEYIREEKSVI